MQSPVTCLRSRRWPAFLFFALSVLVAVIFAVVAISIAAAGEGTLRVIVFVACSAAAMIEAWIFGRRLK